MAQQAFFASAFIAISGAALISGIRRGFTTARRDWLLAHLIVVVCGMLSLAFMADQAGWLTCALFTALVPLPGILLLRAGGAEHLGQYDRAALLLRIA